MRNIAKIVNPTHVISNQYMSEVSKNAQTEFWLILQISLELKEEESTHFYEVEAAGWRHILLYL